MTLRFYIHYLPEEGQDIYLNIVEGEKVVMSRKMGTGGDGEWELEMRYESLGKDSLTYYYSLQDKDNIIGTEWMMPRGEGERPLCPHRIPTPSSSRESVGGLFCSYDNWMMEPIDAIMFTEPFINCLNKRAPAKPYQNNNTAILRIKVYAPQLRGNERLVLCGSHPFLGEWQPERGIPCYEQSPNEWICDLNTEYIANEDIEYKFVAITENQKVSWEIGYNRTITPTHLKKGEVLQYCQRPAAFERPNPRMAGTIVNIKSAKDFDDIPDIIDWMADTHQQWLVIDTKEITRSNYTKELHKIKDYALSRNVVMECKITSNNIPLSVWWDKDTERASLYYKEVLQRRDKVPHPIPAWLARDIMMRELLRQDTMLCLFPYNDWKLLGDIKTIRIQDNIREMLVESQRIY